MARSDRAPSSAGASSFQRNRPRL